MNQDTIAAISTGMTNSGIGIVRISGSEALEIADRVYKGKETITEVPTHTIHYGHIMDGEETVDEVLVMVMRGPRTFTGEDTVEINCHGGTYVVSRVLETVLKAGARPAEPGEFTKRAFLNGKMDLSQAEAVIDVITSENEYALQSSISQLKGSVKNRIKEIREKIIYHTAFIETALDDPEHISVDGYGEVLKEAAEEVIDQLKELIDSSDDGRIMKEGIQTVILGKPNVGKSSLLNILAGHDRAIVTDIAGTTRDVVTEHLTVGGVPVEILDTAGIRETADTIEAIGVERAKAASQEADLVLYVVDASRGLDSDDESFLSALSGKACLLVVNKSDLNGEMAVPGAFSDKHVRISAKAVVGIDALEKAILGVILHDKTVGTGDTAVVSNARHIALLERCAADLASFLDGLSMDMSKDILVIDLQNAWENLGLITGDTASEDLIDTIFSKFCLGK